MTPGTGSSISHAKINVFLEVTGKRQDGFHDLESVVVEVDFSERLQAVVTDGPDIVLDCAAPGVPADGRNLVVRAAEMVRRSAGVRRGLRLRLEKCIPPGTGLGGGSANAAAALRLANTVWQAGLDGEALFRLAAALGSDVPFFLRGGVCLCRGRGEILQSLAAFPAGLRLLVAVPPLCSDTAAAYRGVILPKPDGVRRADAFVAAMAAGDVAGMEREAFNRFEETVFRAMPELGRLRDEMAEVCNRPVRLSGSGSALWCFAAPKQAEDGALAAWAAANRVRLQALSAVPRSTRTG